MHKKLLNRLRLELRLAPEGPLLIKAGEGVQQANPALPDMAFVRCGGELYLPGASLKGVLRSQCEYIARSLVGERGTLDNRWLGLACDPLDAKQSCSWREDIKKAARGAEAYARSCFVCQLFGNTHLASHILFTDARPVDPAAIVIAERNGVAIDRVFGDVAFGPFQFETLLAGEFATYLELQNFTPAHLGLFLMALRDLKDQYTRLGFGKTRGLGRLRVEIVSLELVSYQANGTLHDFVVAFPPEYQAANDTVRLLVPGTRDELWGTISWSFRGEQMAELFPLFAKAWLEYLDRRVASKGGP